VWKEKGIATIGWNKIGNLKQYKSKTDLVAAIKKSYKTKREPKNNAKTCYDFTYTMKVGDRLLAKKGHDVILGIGEVVGSYKYEEKSYEHVNIRKVNWIKVGEWQVPKNNWDKALIEITDKPLLQKYLDIIDKTEPPSDHELQSKNIILYGPPGTGKTYSTINYALSIIENKDIDLLEKEDRSILRERFESYRQNGRVGFVSFHQSFSYEDFIEGIKPIEPEEKDEFLKYKVEDGIFKRMCVNSTYGIYFALQEKLNSSKRTEFSNLNESIDYERKKALINGFNFKEYPENVDNYVLIIDEINRGNIANIFGELVTLIEPDKRAGLEEALSTTLPYSKTEFTVPPNLHIIGTMNTADRSVEALDTALRRRFTFVEKTTDLSLIKQPSKLEVDLQAMLRAINNRIEALRDKDHCIGHSYFMKLEDSENPERDLKQIFGVRIIPLLQEYFYGDPVKIGMVLGRAFVEKKKYMGNEALKFAPGFESEFDDFERKDVYEIKDPLRFANMEPFKAIYVS
jgi:5-methylcytosine-specific restriction protein B